MGSYRKVEGLVHQLQVIYKLLSMRTFEKWRGQFAPFFEQIHVFGHKQCTYEVMEK